MYLRCQKIHFFGASKTMNNNNVVLWLVLGNSLLPVSQISSISKFDSWCVSGRIVWWLITLWWRKFCCLINHSYKTQIMKKTSVFETSSIIKKKKKGRSCKHSSNSSVTAISQKERSSMSSPGWILRGAMLSFRSPKVELMYNFFFHLSYYRLLLYGSSGFFKRSKPATAIFLTA